MSPVGVGPGLQTIVAHVAAIAGAAGPDQLLELRHRLSAGGMGQRFFPADRPNAVATAAFVLGQTADVFLGICPRVRREGTRDAIAPGWALWVDCDGHAAVDALQRFAPAPAIVVATGTGPNCHGYWPLADPLAPDILEEANRRLADAIGADPVCAEAARVLRVPGTRNHKHDPPVAVTLEIFSGERLDSDELLAALPAAQARPSSAPTPTRPARSEGDDPLRAIDPEVYVAAMTGQHVGRDRKVSCPRHRDRTPSLHVYKPPADGWFCFGCGRGGSVYDLGSAVTGLSTRGREFLELRQGLYELLLPGEQPPATRRSTKGGAIAKDHGARGDRDPLRDRHNGSAERAAGLPALWSPGSGGGLR